MSLHANGRTPERAIVGALRTGGERRWAVDESLDELGALVRAAGGVVVERIVQERVSPSPASYFGRGKVENVLPASILVRFSAGLKMLKHS